MASFHQHSNENIKFLNSNIEFFKNRNPQEKKWIVQLINLILGNRCPKNLRLQFFGSAEEKDIKIKERNTKIKEILKAIRNVVQSAFQPSEAAFQSNEAAFQPSEAAFQSNEAAFQSNEAAFQPNEAAFQPSEAFWHPTGCQCQDDDCLIGTLRGSGTIIHPDDCQCTSCRVINLVACCFECFAYFNNNFS